jgi:uncharacterized protein involved in outer membrane biogenesis
MRASAVYRSRAARRAVIALTAAVAVFALIGFLAVPALLRYLATGRVAASLKRTVTVGKISFNPFTLRLEIDRLHISGRDPSRPFVDVGHLHVKGAWSSLYRLAPVVSEVTVQRPSIHIVRTAPQQFNFSDLIGGGTPSPTPQSPAKKPMRFSVSNIRVFDGTVLLDDEVVHQRHSITNLQLGVPFIADLASDINIFVQPLLAMNIDGSPLRIAGRARPFLAEPEWVAHLKLDRLDLPLYFGYAPKRLPLTVPKGALSADLGIHFVKNVSGPVIRVEGLVSIDQLDVRDRSGAELASLNRAAATIADLEPLAGIVHIQAVNMDGLAANTVLNANGTNNFTPIIAATSSPQPTPPSQSHTQFELDSFDLTNSSVKLTDDALGPPATFAFNGIHVGLKNFQSAGQTPAKFDFEANAAGGGALAIKGALDLAHSQATADVTVGQLNLPPFQAFARNVLAANLASGKLDLAANVKTTYAPGKFDVNTAATTVSIDNADIRTPDGHGQPLRWKKLSATVAQADLAAHTATVSEVRADEIDIVARRGRDGAISLLSLIKPPQSAPSHPAAAPPTSAGPPWHFRVASVAIQNTRADLEDDMAPQPVKIALAPVNLHLKNVSNDFSKPFDVEIDGVVNRRGSFKADGSAEIQPLKANLHVSTRRLDLAALDPYLSSRLNAKITSAALTTNGAVGLDQARDAMRVRYRGDATLGNVRMLDKVSNESFLTWRSFSADRIDAEVGPGEPTVRVGALALSDFYARVILNRDGRLNLNSIMSTPGAGPTSLTRARSSEQAQTPPPTAESRPSSAESKPIPANVRIGRTTLHNGRVNYTDNFIRPNYSANLTDINGGIGAFGTRSTEPARVVLRGAINGSAPIDISGEINPLAPMAFVDITAKADGVDLPGLTPYSTKYTGYPILKGTLSVNVHYLLQQNELTAKNHISIDQLTFGDRVQNSTAMNLPIRLAVALLKNPNGVINLDVPVSGSLSNPDFSLGGVLLHAFMNIIEKAATSPFTLISSAFGNGKQELNYVEFAPGSDQLTPDAKSKLDTLIKALQARPVLKLNISGRADAEHDREGLRQTLLDRKIAAQIPGGDVEAVAKLPPKRYDKFLTRAYKAAKFPKPRDFLGLTKSLPADEMKKLMLAHVDVTEADLRQLADARANAVRRYLSKQINPARLFVLAPKLTAAGVKENGLTTRADLSLQ